MSKHLERLATATPEQLRAARMDAPDPLPIGRPRNSAIVQVIREHLQRAASAERWPVGIYLGGREYAELSRASDFHAHVQVQSSESVTFDGIPLYRVRCASHLFVAVPL